MEQYEKDNYKLVRQAGPECMVLLKSDGAFPLPSPCKIAAYGGGVRHTIKGGGGSGDVNVRAFSTVEQGLKNAGFQITSNTWLDGYDQALEKKMKAHELLVMHKIAEIGLMGAFEDMNIRQPEYELPIDAEADTAIYVLDRNSCEGIDHEIVGGDYLLTDTEVKDICTCAVRYRKFLLVVNAGCFVDLSPVLDNVSNVLLLSETGIAIGDAFTDVLLGKSYPSGKLSATWAKYEMYPTCDTFANEDDTEYREDIYVGYRYFDTAGLQPLFPFGYGLGYTNFKIEPVNITLEKTKVCISADVTNTGSFCGKEVVQVYVSVPSGRLEQPAQVLATFIKTEELMPQAIGRVLVSFDMADLRSYDMEQSIRVLEKGDYILRLGNSSQDTQIVGTIRLDEEVQFERLSHVGGTVDFPVIKIISHNEDKVQKDGEVLLLNHEAFSDWSVNSLIEEPTPTAKAQEVVQNLTDGELASLCIGNYKENASQSMIGNAGTYVLGAAGETTDMFLKQGIPNLIMVDGPQGVRVAREYYEDEHGVYAGIHDNAELSELLMQMLGQQEDKFLEDVKKEKCKVQKETSRTGERREHNCTAIPVGMALAQSFNPALCEELGYMVGNDMKRVGAQIWLAPALNIHRDPLGGRNFEYYSEDPLLSGKIAAAIVRGAQKHSGCAVTLKHFVCNNQEKNRTCNNSKVSERALRDIYLKGFEIAVKEAHPHCMMSSYNLLNGIHTSERSDLLETVLRKEWGFDGVVMSDWVIRGVAPMENHPNPVASTSASISAGNDLFMPGSPEDYNSILEALADSKQALTRSHLLKSGARIVDLAWRLRDNE